MKYWKYYVSEQQNQRYLESQRNQRKLKMQKLIASVKQKTTKSAHNNNISLQIDTRKKVNDKDNNQYQRNQIVPIKSSRKTPNKSKQVISHQIQTDPIELNVNNTEHNQHDNTPQTNESYSNVTILKDVQSITTVSQCIQTETIQNVSNIAKCINKQTVKSNVKISSSYHNMLLILYIINSLFAH